MRLDLISIFPQFFEPLNLSLIGKANEKGLIEIAAHDLRSWTHDRHHTTDDTPYGGGAGMVMKPEPWGEALDEMVAADPRPVTMIIPTPAGQVFSQTLAAELATKERLVFACGRYEGIDQRVIDYCHDTFETYEVSLGDYVLNGGEVAAVAIVEAVVRLIPGVVGNPDSLVEESHSEPTLEYPTYTKPATWRGRSVPEILLSGDHGKVARWRTEQSEARTLQRRPDLVGKQD